MRCTTILRRAAFAAAVALAALPTLALAGEGTAITVSGGGVAVFTEDSPNPCQTASSNFAAGAKIDANGKVTGQFNCMIKDCFGDQFTVIGTFTEVLDCTQSPDSVTLRGNAKLELRGSGVVDEFPFTVELHEGGPGTGFFVYQDPAVPDPGDTEIVESGHIMIKYH